MKKVILILTLLLNLILNIVEAEPIHFGITS